MTPAILGGRPAFAEMLAYARPTFPPFARVLPSLRQVYDSGIVTNAGLVARLEKRIRDRVGAADAVAVSSCTSGLVLLLRALGLQGEVVMPSLTFFATAHAAVWNGLEPVLVDCCPGDLTMDPELVERAIGPRTAAILGVHLFGAPCDADRLAEIGRRHGIPVLYDAAHALGSVYRGQPAGSLGLAEVFSLGPSKLVCGGEGGVVTTMSTGLARKLRWARDYGNSGDYDPKIIGLNARMSEFHAAIALASLEDLDRNLENRSTLAALYHELLDGISGIGFQEIDAGNRSALKDCLLLVREHEFGMSAAELAAALKAENIDCRRYFDPPLHRQTLLAGARRVPEVELPVTRGAAMQALCPPFYSHLPQVHVRCVASAIRGVYESGNDVRKALRAASVSEKRAA